ncbi:hypothetical protein N7G274_002227 [Stereocaulon virgatum]|uniref:Plus3 domain-containing protein n=1 Tax=Stereocaulon virgatum TaxID=373712 RepID=A0ABR4AI15_9LECA
MDVEDAEILALAGGDSSDEESPATAATAKAASPLPPTSSSQQYAIGASPGMSNSTPNASAKVTGGSKRVKKAHKDDSDEEGEASSTPASPNSLQSAPMSESDSDSSPADDAGVNGPMFPIENKFKSEKDKREIMALSEVQRESILAERAQLLEDNWQNQHLRRLLQAQQSRSGEKKRKAADIEDSPGNRKSSRQKTTLGGRKVGETSAAIDAYKRQREEKGLRDQQRRREGANRKKRHERSSSGNRYSSADADGESDVEFDDARYNKVEEYKSRNAQPADYNDVRRATLPRRVFAEYCFYPGFGEAVKDCYVRLPNATSKTGEMTYQLALIKGITEKEGWDYAIERDNGKRFATNQHALIVIDGTVKEFHFNGISNSTITEAEVANYKNKMTDDGKPLPTKPFLELKLRDVDSVVNHRFTDAELQEKLRRSGALAQRTAPIERISINNRRRIAEDRGDEAAIAKCDAELAALNGPKLRYGTSLIDPKAQGPALPTQKSQQDRLAELNARNRKQNKEDVRKAQLAERKAERLSREAVQRGEAVQNPFARVKTYAKTHHDVNNKGLTPNQQITSRNVSRSGTPAATTPKPEETKPPFPSPPQKFTASGMPILSNRNMDDEIIAAMDLGIDIEI